MIGSKRSKLSKEYKRRHNKRLLIRRKTKQYLKNECEECESKENLTVHHKISLDNLNKIPYEKLTNPENCQTLCLSSINFECIFVESVG